MSHRFLAADLQVPPALALTGINLNRRFANLSHPQDPLTVHQDLAGAAGGLGDASGKCAIAFCHAKCIYFIWYLYCVQNFFLQAEFNYILYWDIFHVMVVVLVDNSKFQCKVLRMHFTTKLSVTPSKKNRIAPPACDATPCKVHNPLDVVVKVKSWYNAIVSTSTSWLCFTHFIVSCAILLKHNIPICT